MEHEKTPILRSEAQNDIEMAIASEGNDVLPIVPQLSSNSVCTFSKQENRTLESEERSKSAMKLSGLIIFYLIVMAVEIAGGVKANSLAVITDAAHLLTDVAGVSVSLFTVWASGWEATSHQSFGYSRLEVLGALLSVQLIWLISGILIYEAIDKILHKSAGVNGGLMFGIAAFGFIINLIMVIWLGHDHSHHHDYSHHSFHDHNHDHIHNHERENLCAINEEQETEPVSSLPVKTNIMNINVQGAYLHVLADLIQSVGVMVAGAIIWAKPGWLVVDLICTLVFAVFALCTTLPMLRNIFSILMERTPCEINVDALESDLKCIKGVRDIHDLHVWSITVGKLVLSCHVEAEPGASSTEIVRRIRDCCEKTYRIHHTTVQIEQ